MLRARYNRITFFFARILISLAVWELLLPRLGQKKWVQGSRSRRLRRSAAQFRSLAIEMGGVLIKLGQFFSARVDVLPVEVTSELAGLQDEVPPENFEDLRLVAEAEFGIPLHEKYSEFNETPLAAASLGQAHQARILVEDIYTGELDGDADSPSQKCIASKPDPESGCISVVVKIQRPNIETIISTDLAAMRTVGKWLQRYRPISRRMNIPALMEEFTRILYEEIDYIAEGRNAEIFAENFKDQVDVCVPRVFWTHTTEKVLTLEDVRAIKITDYRAIKEAGIDPASVASHLLDTYLKQIFEDGFFHADPHPGNLFVSPVPPNGMVEMHDLGWQLTFVDFGMVGRVPQNLRAGMREGVIGIGTRDAARLIKAYQMLGILLPDADLSLLERAEVEIFNRYWGKNMTELQQISVQEMQELAVQFRELLYKMPFQVPEDLILLGRTVGILSGMCTGLDPHFNVWERITPFAKKLLSEEITEQRQSWIDVLGSLAKDLLKLPQRTENMLVKMERGELAVRAPELTRHVRRLDGAVRQVAGSLVFAALLLGGIQLYLGGEMRFSVVLLVLAGLALGWVFILTIWGRI